MIRSSAARRCCDMVFEVFCEPCFARTEIDPLPLDPPSAIQIPNISYLPIRLSFDNKLPFSSTSACPHWHPCPRAPRDGLTSNRVDFPLYKAPKHRPCAQPDPSFLMTSSSFSLFCSSLIKMSLACCPRTLSSSLPISNNHQSSISQSPTMHLCGATFSVLAASVTVQALANDDLVTVARFFFS